MRVLLIDDSSTMRKIQKKSLVEIGIEDITEAENGRIGLEKLQADGYKFTFVMCDINMPEMSGIELLKAVRADPNSNKIPIIMCTSVADKEVVLDCIKSGANNYIVKPFSSEDLKKKVQALGLMS
ncbi:MAG: hypothetical protein RL095_745 [Verrucomicrobiota bacterium]|jgi:two-component system chemotaxis response regulator CheY